MSCAPTTAFWRRFAAVLFILAVNVVPSFSQAQGPVITQYTLATSVANPSLIVNGPDGALWFSETGNLARITTSGAITEYPLEGGFVSALAVGPDGALWFGQLGRICRMTTAGSVTLCRSLPATTSVSSLTTGPDGALWFVEANANKIGKITTSGEITEYPLASSFPEKRPLSIVAGSDGALWFAESGGNAIGRITTSGAITEFPLPTPFSNPGSIAAGSDGALWFTEIGQTRLGRITTAGAITEFPLLTGNTTASNIVAGPDGALWYAMSGGRFGRITTSGVRNEYVMPVKSGVRMLVGGPDGLMWFTEGQRVGRLDPNGTVGGGTLIQAYSKQGTGVPSISVPIGGTRAGNMLIAAVRMETTSQGVTISDTLGSSFTEAVSQTQDQDGHKIHIFFAPNIAAGANTVTATFSGNNDHSWLSVYEYAGIPTANPLDRTARAQGFGPSPSTGLTPETTNAHELLFALTGQASATYDPIQPGVGFNLLQADSGHSRAATEAAIVTTQGTYAATFSMSDPHIWSAALATFVTTGPPIGPTITTNALPNANQNVTYDAALSAAGGTAPYRWSVIAGSLPSALALHSEWGMLSGRPDTPGTSNFTVQLTDANGQTATRALSITVGIQAPSVTMEFSLPEGRVGSPYSGRLQASGGSPPYAWSVAGGSFPPGLTLNADGTVTGAPTSPAIFNFTVQVMDSRSQTGTKDWSITVYSWTEETASSIAYTGTWFPNSSSSHSGSSAREALDPGSRATFTFTGTEVSWMGLRDEYSGIANVYLDGELVATVDTYSQFVHHRWPIYTAANLPNTSHTISIEATGNRNSFSGGGWIWLDGFKVLGPRGEGSVYPTIDTSWLPAATQNVPYNAQLVASGGTTPYKWGEINRFTLPAGLSFNTTTGVFSGTPTTLGYKEFGTVVIDSNNRTGAKTLSIVVNPSTNSPLSITTTSLPGGRQNIAYSSTVAATGGQSPYTWSISSGSAPPGLSLSTNGTLSGAPNTAGTFTFNVRVTDAASTQATRTFSVSIAAAPATPPPPAGVIEENHSSVTTSAGWYSLSRNFFSGGGAIEAIDPGSRATVTFTGTQVTWIGYQDEYSGIANVYLDGSLVASVDTYGTQAVSQKRFYTASGLSAGTHTLAIEASGTRNPASFSSWIWIDAFEIAGDGGSPPPPPPPGGGAPSKIEETDASIAYAGSWATNGGGFNSGNSAVLSTDAGSSATVSFNGTAIRWIGLGDEWSGIAEAYIDGVLHSSVDTYRTPGQAQVTQYTISGLSSGAHTLKIVVTGNRNPASAQAWIWVDAFEIQP
jgi:virginiamycin B lyase